MYEDFETQGGERAPAARPKRRMPSDWGRSISPAMALLPLRLFLGITFVYAGIQKLSDPGFLHPGAPTYIGTQLHGFATGTPGGFILRAVALPHPGLSGVGVAVTEILIGLLVTAGFFTRIAAAAGMGLNLLLFLTASWHTTPYFLGPDLVFSFAWVPFVLAGASGQPALDNMVIRPSAALARRTQLRPVEGEAGAVSTRRALLAEFAGIAIAIAGISALAKGSYSGPRTLTAGSGVSGAGSPKGGSGGSGKAAPAPKSGGSGSLPGGAVKLGPGKRLPSGQAASYSDPADGSPDILIRNTDGSLTAFSAVCTHAGCTVGYEGGTIVCPCHGGEFNAETGEVIAGPPPSGLAPRKVLEVGGQIYAVPS
jgi:thiosulfate dehydrogenase [quinone] large subunit